MFIVSVQVWTLVSKFKLATELSHGLVMHDTSEFKFCSSALYSSTKVSNLLLAVVRSAWTFAIWSKIWSFALLAFFKLCKVSLWCMVRNWEGFCCSANEMLWSTAKRTIGSFLQFQNSHCQVPTHRFRQKSVNNSRQTSAFQKEKPIPAAEFNIPHVFVKDYHATIKRHCGSLDVFQSIFHVTFCCVHLKVWE